MPAREGALCAHGIFVYITSARSLTLNLELSCRQLHGREDPVTRKTLGDLAHCLDLLGRANGAAAIYDESAIVCREVCDRGLMGLMVLWSACDLVQALSTPRIRAQVYGEQDPRYKAIKAKTSNVDESQLPPSGSLAPQASGLVVELQVESSLDDALPVAPTSAPHKPEGLFVPPGKRAWTSALFLSSVKSMGGIERDHETLMELTEDEQREYSPKCRQSSDLTSSWQSSPQLSELLEREVQVSSSSEWTTHTLSDDDSPGPLLSKNVPKTARRVWTNLTSAESSPVTTGPDESDQTI